MKKILSQRDKMKAAITLFIVIVLIAGINRMNSNTFTSVQESFESVYKDRVIVNDYIFRLARIIEDRKAEILTADQWKPMARSDYRSINNLLDKYALTKFSADEHTQFAILNERMCDLWVYEDEIGKCSDPQRKENLVADLGEITTDILHCLDELSTIQVIESKSLFENSNERMQTGYMNAQVELVFLIIICSLVIALFLVNPLGQSLASRLSELN